MGGCLRIFIVLFFGLVLLGWLFKPSDDEIKCNCHEYYSIYWKETKEEYFKRRGFTKDDMTKKTEYNSYAIMDTKANIAWEGQLDYKLRMKETCFKRYTFENLVGNTYYREEVSQEELEKRAKNHCETGEKNDKWG